MSLEPLETAEGHADASVTQLSVFIDNRVGQLLRLTRLLEQTEVHILALSVVNSVDCAIIRMIVDEPDDAAILFRDNHFAVSESELTVVSLPPGKRGLIQVLMALMSGELNISYTYPLLVRPHGQPAVAVQTENPTLATSILRSRKFDVLDQSDLVPPGQ